MIKNKNLFKKIEAEINAQTVELTKQSDYLEKIKKALFLIAEVRKCLEG